MDDYIGIGKWVLVICFGYLIIYFRLPWAQTLVKAKKVSPFWFKDDVANEENEIFYAKQATIILGMSFICAGFFSILKLLKLILFSVH